MPNLLKKKEEKAEGQNQPKVKKENFFLTIILTEKYLQSSLVSNNGQGVQIKEFSEIKSYFDRKDLLEQLDVSLQELGPESEDVVETVFTFDDSWLTNGELSDEKKAVIKELTESLSLEAIGQFSIGEALAEARLIADENDSCMMLSFKDDSFDLILLKHGNLLNLINIGRSNDIVADLQEALARVSNSLEDENKYFPNKVLLTSIALNQKELNKLSNGLHKFDWASNPGFLQEPGIVVLENDYMIKSISLSAGKILTKEDLKVKKTKQKAPAAKVAEPLAPSPAPQKPEEHANVEETVAASSFGIAVDEGLLNKKKLFAKKEKVKEEKMTDSLDKAIEVPKKNKKRSKFARFVLAHKKGIWIGAGSGLVSLIVVSSIFALFFSKVRVELVPDQVLLQRSTQITLDPNIEESNFEDFILKASIEEKNITGQDVTETTGISLVGEKATGKVNVFNKTNEEKTFDAGTVISYDNIKFSLDDEIKVASATEKTSGSGTDYGKAEVDVTAQDIGADANLTEDTKLRVADFYDDEFSASVLENFEGGSSREIRVVAVADQNKLSVGLKEKLLEEAKMEFELDSKDGVYFLPTGNSTVASSNFSGEKGEETESLTLDLSLDVEAVKYLSTDLRSLAAEALKQDLPENYQFLDEEPELMTAPAGAATNSTKIKLDAELMAKAEAQLNLEEIKTEILGKEFSEVLSILKSKETIEDTSIKFNMPFISGILKKLPNNAKRVVVSIAD